MEIKKVTERIQNDLEELARFTATPGSGCTRLPFTKEARGAVEYIKKEMAEAGLLVWEDAAGNVFGILEGENREAPCIMMGSHYDSVINGGNFDGIAGVACAIEVARQLRERGVPRKRSFVAAGFCDEEGTRFGTGFFGSGAMLGKWDVEACQRFKDTAGISVYEAMEEYGLDPRRIKEAEWRPGSIGCFIEAHVEQGPVLAAKGTELGLVDCIVGIQRYMVTVKGRADHAGTTPMDMRIDAMEMAGRVISSLPGWAREYEDGTVATVGYIHASPGGINIVAKEVQFSVDIRSRSNRHIDEIAGRLKEALEAASVACGGSYEMEQKLKIRPLHLSEELLAVMERACMDRGYSYQRMPSGAGHDTLEIGQTIPSVMVFVPSKDGRSHCPVEWSAYEDLAKAAVLSADLVEAVLCGQKTSRAILCGYG